MRERLRISSAALALMLVSAVASGQTRSAGDQQATASARSGSDVEEVFVYLAVRSNRQPGASDPTCDDAGFPVRNRNDFDLRAVRVRPDGTVDPIVGDAVGVTVSCFSAKNDAGTTQFFARLTINGINAAGRGECLQRYVDFPEPRVGVQECWLKLTSLPQGYTGGFLTVNAVATRVGDAACVGAACGRGLESDPPGYGLPSITTLRLWKPRPASAPLQH